MASSCSSSGWLGSLTSRRSESDLSRQESSVELQQMASAAPSEASDHRSKPVDIPQQGAALAPGVVPQAQQPHPAAAAAAKQPSSTQAGPRPVLLEHPLSAITHEPAAHDMTSYSSIGLDLPSALTVPAIKNVSSRSSTSAEQQQLQDVPAEPTAQPSTSSSSGSSNQRDQPAEVAPGAVRASKVTWLPGDVVAAPAGSRTQQPDSSSSSSSPGPQLAVGSDKARTTVQSPGASSSAAAATTTAAGSASATRSARPALFRSGNEQLDKYLSYLLKEAHPHKHMYYPAWGVSDDGCAAVGDFLRRDRRLKVATLADNGIRDDGVELIADGLAHNSSLLTLDLSSNKITNVGAIALAEALHSNKTLAELNLNNNRIGDDGAEALAAAASSSALKKLHLTGNLISSGQLSVVQHVLKTREYKMVAKPNSSSNSRHMRKSSSLQFVIELSEGSCQEPAVATAAHCKLLQLPPATAVAALTESTDSMESSLAMQVAHLLAELHSTAADANAASGDASAILVCLLAVRLAWRGYDVVIRTSCPSLEQGDEHSSSSGKGDAAGSGCAALRHTFVLVMQPGETSSPLVVDPTFKELFAIPHPTERYQSALDALPRTLVLLESRLYHLVEALCNEMAAAFKEQSLAMPPWRAQGPVLDKFFSGNKQDVAVDGDMSLDDLQAKICS